MQKIMFNDKLGLTRAVLEGRKTMTRRAIPNVETEGGLVPVSFWNGKWCGAHGKPLKRQPYGVGEVLAIAQPYKDLFINPEKMNTHWFQEHKGWNNKMFVAACNMPHHIRITDVKVERLQDISEEDCLKEGIECTNVYEVYGIESSYVFEENPIAYDTPSEAFAALIDKVSGKGTWSSNPYVFAYSFELVD